MRTFLTLLLCLYGISKAEAQAGWQTHDSPVKADLHNVFFVTDSVGWIITHNTGAVLHTKNGGEAWFVQAKMDSMYFEDVYFLNEQIGWVSGQYGLIFKTTDGGNSWKRHKIADKKSWIYSLYFFNKNKGIAVGLRESRPFTVFLKTDNGGAIWNNISQKVPSTIYEPIFFHDDQTGYVGGEGKIISTNNGAETWNLQFSDITSNSNCRETVRGLTFLTSKIGWAVGQCGLILKTKDGESWQRHKKFTLNSLRDIAFVNKTEGYIVGDSNKEPGVLYHTNDSGKTWETVLTDAPDLHRIELTKNRIWLVGDDGIILSKPISE